jgi:hypothetical protein
MSDGDWFAERRKKMGKHHPWCNFFMDEPAATCAMCSGLHKEYPSEGKTADELQQEHFPNVRKIDD